MAREGKSPKERPAADRGSKKKPQSGGRRVCSTPRGTAGATPPAPPPGCRIIGGEGSCPEWEDLLREYTMIDSVQREDFPEHGASFAYLAHFYRTNDTAREGSLAQEEFEAFFRAIGYKYDYAGNYESRWFEGIGVKIR